MTGSIAPIIYSLDQIDSAASEFIARTAGSRIFAFSGALGAGKTTFITALCRRLGVADHISSPTFSLVNQYQISGDQYPATVYHMDWYRLRDAEEAINAGMEYCLTRQDAICFVEWPEQAPELLEGLSHIFVTIEASGDATRILTAARKG